MTWYDFLNSTVYVSEGTWVKTIPLTGITDATGSAVSWTGTATVEAYIDSWQTLTSGGSIAEAVGDLTGKHLTIRITLTPVAGATPSITDFTATISQDEYTLFFGIVGIPESPVFTTEFIPDVYRLQVQSANALLRRRTASEAYQNENIADIIQDLFTKYIATEGVTLGNISTVDFTYDVYVVQRKYVADILTELAGPVGATWHISPDKKFYFTTKTDFPSVSAPSHIKGLKKSTSGIDQRTVQVIAGARSRTATQTQTDVWGADQKQIVLGFPLAQAPTITINGSPATVGVKGLDGDDTSVTFLWSYESDTVSVNSSATTTPATGDTVVISYVGFFDVEIENQNGERILQIAELTGTSGRIEKVATDTSIETFQDGSNLADELLDRYGEAEETIFCETDDVSNTELLTVWTFNYPTLNIEGDYIITERSMSRLSDEKPRVRLTLKSKQFYTQYGEVYNKYDRNIRRLSVNESNVIIKTEAGYNERLQIADDFTQAYFMFYPTSGDFSDPTALFYPFELEA